MICYDLAEIDDAIESTAVPTAAKLKAKAFARGIAYRGVVGAHMDTWDDGRGLNLRYFSECADVKFTTDRHCNARASVDTKHDNGHAVTNLDVSPRSYGLIAAMLLART